MLPFRVTLSEAGAVVAATCRCQVQFSGVAAAPQTEMSSSNRKIRGVTPVAGHAAENAVGMGPGHVFYAEMAGHTSFRPQLPAKGADLKDFRLFVSKEFYL